MFVEVSPYTRVQNQILTPSNLFLFVYSQLKLSGCLFTFPTVDKNELALLYKTVGLFLSAISKYIYIYFLIHNNHNKIQYKSYKGCEIFFTIYVLHSNICLCGDIVNCLWKCFFVIPWERFLWQHQFSQEVEANSNVATLGHCLFKEFHNT